jgi:predicted ester cyclase
MSEANKQIVARWFKEFWGYPWNPNIVSDLATPHMVVHYPMHEPKIGRAAVAEFMTEFRKGFPDLDFWPVGDFIAEGDYVVSRWKGGGTHSGAAFCDLRLGSLPAASGRKMRFSGTTIFRIENGRIAEELGQEDALTAMQQLGLINAPSEYSSVTGTEGAVPLGSIPLGPVPLGGFWAQTLGREISSLPHGWNRLPPRGDSIR